jgi:hypothetical protein
LKLAIVVAIGLALTLAARSTSASGSPYPMSPVILGVTFDFSTHHRAALGSDNWPVTWADDDHQYAAFGDGGGFGGDNDHGRVSLGVARVEGDWDAHLARNVWGGADAENPAQFDGKSYGIISVDGVLYMWVIPGSDAANYGEARLARSADRGATWALADWAFTAEDRLVVPTFLQFGRDYAGARDAYVYGYSIRLQDGSALQAQKPGQVDLMRAPRDRIMDRAAYEFFAGLDGDGAPRWTPDLGARAPVFEDPAGVGWSVSVSHNPGLRRYLLATEHTASFQGNLGLFDAPEPWGPWTTVAYEDNWGGPGNVFYWNFANKWLSADGRDFTLVFSGVGDGDAWNSVRGRFATAGTTP